MIRSENGQPQNLRQRKKQAAEFAQVQMNNVRIGLAEDSPERQILLKAKHSNLGNDVTHSALRGQLCRQRPTW